MENEGRRLGAVLLAATLSVTTAQFIEIQKLSAEDLRARFRLAPSCQPSVTALSTDPGVNQVTIAIECRTDPGASPSPRPPGARSRSPGRDGKGS